MIRALIRRLQESPDIQRIAGSRVYWQRAPQGQSPPYVLLHVIAELPESSFAGASNLTETTVQIDAFGGKGPSGAAAAWALGNAIRSQLHGWEGSVGTPDAPYRFWAIFQTASRDVPVDPRAGEQEHIYGVSRDFTVWHEFPETTAALS